MNHYIEDGFNTFVLKYRIRSWKESESRARKDILLSITKVNTFKRASSSLKSVIVLLRLRLASIGRKKSDSKLVITLVVETIYIISNYILR